MRIWGTGGPVPDDIGSLSGDVITDQPGFPEEEILKTTTMFQILKLSTAQRGPHKFGEMSLSLSGVYTPPMRCCEDRVATGSQSRGRGIAI